MSGLDKISKEIITNQNNRVIIQLTKPLNDEEMCSITLEPIYENPSIHDFKILDSPCMEYKDYKCIELSCNHRFNGMALLIHFCTNHMTCPMCRQGLENDVLNYGKSFPGEPWIEIMQNILMNRDSQFRNIALQNAMHIFPTSAFTIQNPDGTRLSISRNSVRDILNQDGPIFPSASTLSSMFNELDYDIHQEIDNESIHNSYTVGSDFQMFAIFHLFRQHPQVENTSDLTQAEQNNINRIILTFRCNLQQSTNGSFYTISRNNSRIIANAIQDMNIQSISAIIYAHNIMHNSDIQVATMRRIPINSQQRVIEGEVIPPIYSIQINLEPSSSHPQNVRHHSNILSQVENDMFQAMDFVFMAQRSDLNDMSQINTSRTTPRTYITFSNF